MAKQNEITVLTHPNGYSLKVNDTEYMYFSEVDLLAGMIAHVGMHETKHMDQGTILSTLAKMMLGQEYATNVDNLKARIEAQYERFRKLEGKLALIEREIMPIDPKPRKTAREKRSDHQGKEMSDDAKAKLADIEERMKSNPNIV